MAATPVQDSEELQRVLALERRPARPEERWTAAVTEAFKRPNARCGCRLRKRDCITKLRPVQAWALREIAVTRGLLGPIGVGHGKTMLDILAPLAMPDCRVAMLLIPPGLVTQLIKEYELVSEHFVTPGIIVHGKPYTRLKTNLPTLHVFPYSRLSGVNHSATLEKVGPDTIIADECHLLRNATATRTKRFLRFCEKHPNARFCGWSGSLTDKSIKDYAHLSALALKDKSPLPLKSDILDEWSKALDPSAWPSPGGALYQLCGVGERLHDGFRRRLLETPGVVTTKEPAVDAKITIKPRDPGPIPAAVLDALEDLRNSWTRPDGEEFVDALSLAKCARELACGFYYRWVFPNGEPVELILKWLEARKRWNREVRDILKQNLEHLDSPKLVENAAKRGCGDLPQDPELPQFSSISWTTWRDVASLVKPQTDAVRISDYLVNDVALWATKNRGVVWTAHREFGEWVAESLDLPFHGGGPKAPERLGREKGDRSVIASIQAHGTGRDGLQRLFATQLIATPPSSATAWEQTLGRLHRVGQKALEVTAYYYAHTPELEEAVSTALTRAEYVQGTLGSKQKIVEAKERG